MLESLRDIPIVGDVRGAGYFQAIELVKDHDTKESLQPTRSPSRCCAASSSGELFRRGLICRADDRGDPVIQLSPPLIAEPEEFAEIEARAARRPLEGGRARAGVRRQDAMKVGVPTEIKTDEYRVALTPAGVRELADRGHEVLVQAGAGDGSAIADDEYVAQGATIVPDADAVFAEADLIVKVKEPQPAEVALLRAAATRCSPTCTSRPTPS